MSDTDFIAQMANFSSLQEMQTLTNNFSSYSTPALESAAQDFLGKQVTVTDSQQGSVTGTVTAIDSSSGSPEIVVNGTSYDISTVTNVTTAAAAGSSNTQSN
jgi:flagellar basal-body rod modification protein FlgD